MRAPVLGGNFGVWGGLFSTFDCAVKGVRKKEDPYNAIIAGFFTGGALAIRGGYKAARNGAIGCAVLLAVIEGVGISFQKMMAGSTKLEVSRRAFESRHLVGQWAGTNICRLLNHLRKCWPRPIPGPRTEHYELPTTPKPEAIHVYRHTPLSTASPWTTRTVSTSDRGIVLFNTTAS